ncbi:MULTISPECIES: nitroreductase family protein [unclassified Moraxella]|uniref:nitroreductase family protein n=1 Tax=unclassified Moraxella TaxID=2685852 RepID=UPI003AF658E5
MPTLSPIANPKQVSFHDVVTSRRAVRRFTDTPIPDNVLNACLDMAMLAPSSSNLQPWQFFVIDSKEKRQKANQYCMNQNACRTANRLIVVVARTDTWQQNAKDNINHYPVKPVPKAVKDYYGKLIPVTMTRGAMNVFAPAKWALTQAVRQVKGAMVEPIYNAEDLKNWALVSTSLACQNLMLAFRAYGFDSCPMGGFDEPQMKKLLGLNEHQHICMVIGAGERDERGIYSEQYRFERERFIKTV